jgi:thiamine biosynthesis lipoprotein
MSSFPNASGRTPLGDGVSRRGLLSLGRARPAQPAADGHWIRVFRRAMACRFEVTLPGDRAADIAAARASLEEADRLEAALSIFRPTSELSLLNQLGATSARALSDELFALLARCHELSAATAGAFDITSTPLSACWGFLRRQPQVPSEPDLAAARALVGMHQIVLDIDTRTARLAGAGVSVNLGAIGKGYAVQAVAKALRAHGVADALVSAGGSSVVAMGGGRAGWRVDVTSARASRRLARLRLRNAALGTSGAGEQYLEIEGTRHAHVIDPRTGLPSSGIVSASVVTTDAATADALATAFFVGGLELARSYCDAHPGTLALMTPDDGREQTIAVGGCRGAIVEDCSELDA